MLDFIVGELLEGIFWRTESIRVADVHYSTLFIVLSCEGTTVKKNMQPNIARELDLK